MSLKNCQDSIDDIEIKKIVSIYQTAQEQVDLSYLSNIFDFNLLKLIEIPIFFNNLKLNIYMFSNNSFTSVTLKFDKREKMSKALINIKIKMEESRYFSMY